MAHALLSPSSAVTWLNCPGAPALYKDMPEETSEYAEEGTRAHALAEQAAINEFSDSDDRADLEGDAEMVECAVAWAQVLREAAAPGLAGGGTSRYTWHAEQRVNIGHITGNPEDRGTADFAALLAGKVLLVADFKYGRGVPVKCEENPQLMTYASGLLNVTEIRRCVERVRLVIFQPRLSKTPQVWETTVEHIDEFTKAAKAKAEQAMKLVASPELAGGDLHPGEAQCRFCKAKAVCPALRQKVIDETRADFEIIPTEAAPKVPALVVPETGEMLARALPWLETIEKWCDAVRKAAMSNLEQGKSVPGFKLVAGRKGPRKWLAGAEDRLKAMRLRHDVIYEDKLVSPTTAEKAAKAGIIGARQWKALQAFITQNDGAPTIAYEWDKRPALTTVRDDFEVIEAHDVKVKEETEDLFKADEPKAEQAEKPVVTNYTAGDLW